jgi:hypothetical protein
VNNARYEGNWYYCWLIERRDRPQPEWWTAGCAWTTNAHDALWFARKSDAETEAAECPLDIVVCEHGFMLEDRRASPPRVGETSEASWDSLIESANSFKLPVDVKIGAGTFTKGVKVGTMLQCVKNHAGYASEIPDSEYPTLGVWSPDIASPPLAQPWGQRCETCDGSGQLPEGFTSWETAAKHYHEQLAALQSREKGRDAMDAARVTNAIHALNVQLSVLLSWLERGSVVQLSADDMEWLRAWFDACPKLPIASIIDSAMSQGREEGGE